MDITDGPLYAEVMGPEGAPPMVFVHPNPLDSSCWVFQTARFSTWFRTVAIDLPGYGRSPAATTTELTMPAIAAACWEAVDRTSPDPAVLVGCSVGSNVIQHMYHLQPDRVAGLVITGTGYFPTKPHLQRRIEAFRREGLEYRRSFVYEVLSPGFRDSQVARWMADLCIERNPWADLETIIAMLQALSDPDPEWLQRDIDAPAVMISGSEDKVHQQAFDLAERIPNCQMRVVEGAGHASHLEQPLTFDGYILEFLEANGLMPSA